MQQIISKVEKQEMEIDYIKRSLEEIADQNKKQNEQLEKISESIQKQELILEKISNLEEKYYDETKRIYKTINNENEFLTNKIKEVEEFAKDCCNRPCVNHSAIVYEIESLKEFKAKQDKALNWIITTVGSAIVLALLGLIIKN